MPGCEDGRLPTLSIIILNRDGAPLLDRLLRSLSEVNTYPLLEILVVDHASADDSRAVCAAWAERLPVEVIARDANYSYSASNNLAAGRARGDLLLLLNNDIVFTTDALPRMVEVAVAHDALVGVSQVEADADGRSTGRWHHRGVAFRWHPKRRHLVALNAAAAAVGRLGPEGLRFPPAVTASVLLLSRARYAELGGLHEGYDYGYEDVDLCLRATFQGIPVACVHDVSVAHAESSTRRRSSPLARRARLKHNITVFNDRLGGPLWRWWRRAVVAEPDALLGRPLRVFLAGPADTGAPLAAAGWEVTAEADADIVAMTTPQARVAARKRGTPWLARLAVVAPADAGVWALRDDLASFDLMVCGDADTAALLAGRGAATIVAAAQAQGSVLPSALAERLRQPKVAVVGRPRPGGVVADRPAEWAGLAVLFAGRAADPVVYEADVIVDRRRFGMPLAPAGRVILVGAPPREQILRLTGTPA